MEPIRPAVDGVTSKLRLVWLVQGILYLATAALECFGFYAVWKVNQLCSSLCFPSSLLFSLHGYTASLSLSP